MLPTESSVQVRTIQGLPHVRGGVSAIVFDRDVVEKSSPRAWGCFWLDELERLSKAVFPTRVGGAYENVTVTTWTGSSPRTWGGQPGEYRPH